jgi:D-psicose/D-tagatose/L-ribulose 3-epimerase
MNNKVGIYYAFWEQEWAADYFKYVDKVSKLGFDVLELAAGGLECMTSQQRRDLSKAAKDAGIELTYCIGMPAQYDMASPDAAVRARGIEYAKKLLDMIGEMDGKILGGIIYSCWPATHFPTGDKRPWWDRSVESVRKVANTAADEGVTYCLEVVNRFEQFLLNTAAEGVQFVKEVGSDSVKLLLDAFHMNIEEDFIGDAVRSAKGYIGHMHIGEANRKAPGRGHMPWDDLMDGLRDAKYTGRIVMEPFIKMGGQVGQDIRMWRDLSDNGDEHYMDGEATFALNFIRNKLAERS